MRTPLAFLKGLFARPAPPIGITQDDLDQITDSCGAPRDWLVLRGNRVVLLASPDEDEATLTCVLRKMSAIIAANNAGPAGTAEGSEEN